MVAPASPIVRVEDAGLGLDAQVRVVVSRISDLDRLQRAWANSGALLERVQSRLRGTSTVAALARAAGRALPADEAEALVAYLDRAVAAWSGPTAPLPLPGGGALLVADRPAIAGVVNVTDDSFSDGGLLYPDHHPAAAIAHGHALLAEGADLLDIGGESTRPGSAPVSVREEHGRVLPVIERLAADGAVCSVDTTKPEVARAAVAAGAQIVNDVSGRLDPALLQVAAESGAGYVLMHARGTPANMQRSTDYFDVVAEVYEFLADGLAACRAAGIDLSRVVVDPGIGFAKTAEQNLELLRAGRQLRGLGHPVLVGASRKSFLGVLTADAAGEPPPATDRLEASLACVAATVLGGASLIRVHDVAASVRAARVMHAIASGTVTWARPHDPPAG